MKVLEHGLRKGRKITKSKFDIDRLCADKSKLPIKTKNSGIYVIEFWAKNDFSLGIKKYAENFFSKGYYYYSGSAQKNFRERLSRHLRLNKKVHWHIDHLTTDQNFEIKSILILNEAPKEFECKIIESFLGNDKVEQSILGFGNGDCSTCRTHLLNSFNRIDYNQLFSLYHDIVRFIPSSRETF